MHLQNSSITTGKALNSKLDKLGSVQPPSTVGDHTSNKSYGIPTIQLLNPKLYKEMSKVEKNMKDPIATSLKNIKERHVYQDLRQQRIDKKNAEIAKELKVKEDEAIKQGRLKMMGTTAAK